MLLPFRVATPIPDSPRGSHSTKESAMWHYGMTSDSINLEGHSPHPYDLMSLKQAQVNAEPGEQWLITTKGKEPWPGVICDEEMVTDFFKRKDRPRNAKQPDGTWHEHVLPHGRCAGQKCFPFMYLGTMNFGWVPYHRMEPLSHKEMTSKLDQVGLDPHLKQAYAECLCELDLNYWKSSLYIRSLEEEDWKIQMNVIGSGSKVSSRDDSRQALKRKSRGTVSQYPPQLRALERDECEDDEEDDRYIKREPPGDIEASKNSHGILDGDDDTLRDGIDKRVRFNDHSGSTRLRTSRLVDQLKPMVTTVLPVKRATLEIEKVRVYVGNPHQDFVLKERGLLKSSLLPTLVKYQDEESYIMSPLLSALQPKDFASVAEYLDHSEYAPNLLDEGTDYARLEKVETLMECSFAVRQCGDLYQLAIELEIAGLRNLVIRKFQALMPYSEENFILMSRLFYASGRPVDPGLHDFMVTYAVDHFYELWRAQSLCFARLLQEHQPLATSVYQKLGGSVKLELTP